MELTANALQSVSVGNNVLFTNTIVAGCNSIIHRSGSGLVILKGMTSQCRARFRITFTGNIAIPDGTTTTSAVANTLAIAINGEALSEATMISTNSTAGAFNNISTTVFIDVPKSCCNTISVENVGAATVSVENANLIVERVA